MVRKLRSGFAGMMVLGIVMVHMQDKRAAMGFGQDMDDGSMIGVRESDRRREDTECINGSEHSHPPAL